MGALLSSRGTGAGGAITGFGGGAVVAFGWEG